MAIRRTLAEFSDDIATADIADGSVTAAKVAADVATQAELDLKAPLASPAFTGSPSITLGSDATGDVYYRAAGGALTRLATGADGTVLTSTGAAAVPAFEAIPATSTSGWTHILTKSNSNTNTITINQSDNAAMFSSTYPLYMITMTDYTDLSALGNLRMRFEYNGSFPTSGYGFNVQAWNVTTGSPSNSYTDSYEDIKMSGVDTATSSGGVLSGHFIMYMSETHVNSYQQAQWQYVHHGTSSGYTTLSQGVGFYGVASNPITGLQFYQTGGSITWTGTFKIFGLKS